MLFDYLADGKTVRPIKKNKSFAFSYFQEYKTIISIIYRNYVKYVLHTYICKPDYA